MLTAIFLGDPSVNASQQTVMGDTQQELQAEVERLSVELGVNPTNWYGDGYQDISTIPPENQNDWARNVFNIETPQQTGNTPIDMPGLPAPVTPPATPTTPEEPEFEAVTQENQVNVIQIQEIYQQYAGREATPEEIAYHTQSNPISYDDLLNWAQTAPEVKASFDEQQALKDEEQQRYDEGLAIINDSDLPEDQKELWRTLYENYDGDTVDVQQILDTFEQIKTNTLDPYWAGIIDLAEQDFINQLETLSGNREREIETEQALEEQRLRGTQAGLEQRGMTFSGEAVEQLGTRSGVGTAFGEEGTGLLGQQSRLISTASAAEHQRLTQEIGMGIEGQLGSGSLGQFNIPNYTQVGTSQGQLPTQQEQAYGSYLNQLINNAYGVGQYNQNQQI